MLLVAYISFSLKTSAICSFNQSNSFRTEKENSSASDCTTLRAEFLSSAIHADDPTGRRGPRIAAIAAAEYLEAEDYDCEV
jgi:hypothetical protein